eukprot:CAMPEP_0114581032 /NCGR_PEP_ID=MMETSP0125-20121206/5185_1 /TAXON_ID=485358 ORGANISM="Aristerostoma sp., Strain ATCC 50986" /NCGR_SAMPLE_ID=MMETSP0125 /ASSEMBLY_ACC=CAM_ASM_000245 /LENGTH=62 /DNA_ID=CAMNT_0001772923 /DNA_START=1814 /DNA_END=1999 /DNA_ORIENTATION=+
MLIGCELISDQGDKHVEGFWLLIDDLDELAGIAHAQVELKIGSDILFFGIGGVGLFHTKFVF